MTRDGRWPRFVRSIEVFTDEREVQINVLETERPVARRFFDWCGTLIPGLVEGALDYRGEFRVSSNSFFQVNRLLIDRLVEAATEGAEGETAIDLYAGVGLFSLTLARRFREVTAVESGAGAVRDLQFNAARAGLENLHAVAQTAEEHLAQIGEGAGFRGAGSAANGDRQGGSRAAGGVAAAADHDRGVRSGDPGARSGGADGGGLSHRADDAGGLVPADVPFGDGGAAEAGVRAPACLSNLTLHKLTDKLRVVCPTSVVIDSSM